MVHWNTPHLLEACLHSLRDLPADRVTVLVIDNASASGLPALASFAGPPLQILQLADNVGYAGAAFHALDVLRDGRFDALWLLNADVAVDPETFHALEHAAAAEPEAVIGCVVLAHNGDQVRMPEKFLHADRRWRFGRRDREIPAVWFDAPLRPVQAVHGAAMWVPRSVFERHGLFDPSFFLYCEETDYCLRLAKLGVPIRIAGQSRVRHVERGSSISQPAVQQMLDYYRLRNELILWRQHAPFWLPWISAQTGRLDGHECSQTLRCTNALARLV
ncbi:MAG: glycosyltransferase family 2 protein [Ahniella sp.]|nr:glycosyltransferase family 2 protein [Ahniella sp.]